MFVCQKQVLQLVTSWTFWFLIAEWNANHVMKNHWNVDIVEARVSSVGEHIFIGNLEQLWNSHSMDAIRCSSAEMFEKSNGFRMWSLRATYKSKTVLLLISSFSLFDSPLFCIEYAFGYEHDWKISHFRYEPQYMSAFPLCVWKRAKITFLLIYLHKLNFVDLKPHKIRLAFI